jgi:hypothetical protein
MKIAYIVSDFGLLSETFISDLAISLVKNGQEVTVICNQSINNKKQQVFVETTKFLIKQVDILID